MPQSSHSWSRCHRAVGFAYWYYYLKNKKAINKDFQKYRESFTRKVTRPMTNEDIIRCLLCSSDKLTKKAKNSLEGQGKKHVKRLLVVIKINLIQI